MRRFNVIFMVAALMLLVSTSVVNAEILAMVNYESKPDQTSRREGIAIMDVDPESANFGKILMDIPLPYNALNHHIFYNKDRSKAYITLLGMSKLQVMDMTKFPYRMSSVNIPECVGLEDMTFSGDKKRWYLTCIGSNNVIMGDAETDTPLRSLTLPMPWPHGITMNDEIDRLLVTNTVNPADMKEGGEAVTVIEASTGKVIATHRLSMKPSPSGNAPVEVHFIPDSSPPAVYATNMYGGDLWYGEWDEATGDFNFSPAFDFNKMELGVPLVIEFNDEADRLYVSTGVPGHMNIFDISKDPTQPEFMKSVRTAEGAHHMVFPKGGRYAIVQNNLLGLEGLDDGSLTVVDMAIAEPIASIDTLKNMGMNPNCIVLLPEWDKGHGH